MSDYSKSVIYMIKKFDDDDNENVYIGSTNNFTRRKRVHKCSCNNPNSVGYNMKVYQYIRENGGWDEFNMIEIQKYPCNNKDELKEREDEIMCEIKSNLNDIRANRSKKEWYEDNRDKIKEQNKEYRELNEEKIKEYYQLNKAQLAEKAKEYRQLNKEKLAEQKKEYRKLNKEKLAEKRKDWYENNKKKLLEQQNERVKCDICGCESARGKLARHKRSEKCLNHNK
jgi:hypothetical protein